MMSQVNARDPTDINAPTYCLHVSHHEVPFLNIPSLPWDLQVPLMYPIAESFRICIQVMSLPQFPLNVLGSVLARNRTEVLAPLKPGERLLYR